MSTSTPAPTLTPDEVDTTYSWKDALRARASYTQERAMTAVLIVLVLVFWQTAPQFLTGSNLSSIGAAAAYYGVVAVGMTCLFIVGEFDLSLGILFGITTTVIAYMNFVHGWGLWPSILAGLVFAVIVGLANGFFSTVGKVPSFIVTIGMLSVLQGFGQYLSGGQPVTMSTDLQESWLGRASAGSVWGLPAPLILAIVVFLGTAFMLNRTRLGAHLYFTGGNPKAARQMGINATRVKMFAFVFAALLAALAGVVQLFSLGTAQPGTGGGDFLFQAVGAAIIGGVALTGGAGSVYGTFIGTAILAVLTNGLVLSGVNPALGVSVTGALIILAGVLQSGMREVIAKMFQRARIRQSRASAASRG